MVLPNAAGMPYRPVAALFGLTIGSGIRRTASLPRKPVNRPSTIGHINTAEDDLGRATLDLSQPPLMLFAKTPRSALRQILLKKSVTQLFGMLRGATRA
jgi:hypothetical protein